MKKIILVVAAAAAVIAQSCTKDSINPVQDRAMLETGREICFSTTGIEVNASTKVTAVTNENISSFNLLTNNGAADAQSYLWTATASRVGTTPTFQTGRYWPNSNPSYHKFSICRNSFTLMINLRKFKAGFKINTFWWRNVSNTNWN